LAQGLKDTEEKIADIFSKYISEDNSNITIIYNKEYGVSDPSSILAQATTALQMNITPKFNEEVKKQVIRSMLEDTDEKILDDTNSDEVLILGYKGFIYENSRISHFRL